MNVGHKTIVVEDIALPNDVIDLGHYKMPNVVAARSVELPRAVNTTWAEMLPEASKQLLALFESLTIDGDLRFFTANTCDQPDNRITRYKGFRYALDIESIVDDKSTIYSTILESEDGIRFAALIPITKTIKPKLPILIDKCRENRGFFLVEKSVITESSVNSLFHTAFGEMPPYSSLDDWRNIIRYCAAANMVVFKVSGRFDDLKLSIDAFGVPSSLGIVQ